jgi:chaperonin GroEL
MATRKALLVATGSYENPGWNPLGAPLHDAAALAEVLGDPGIGGYAVTTVLDQPAHMITQEILRFLTNARLDDELLVYFSCHGIKDDWEQLFFAGTNTGKDRRLLESEAVPAEFVSRHLHRCRARRKVLLLDCCFSGAFQPGAKGGDSTVDFGGRFAGTGTVVMSATDETQLAFETAEAGGSPGLSVFTASVVEGLRTGQADLDGDGSISAEDLFTYVSAAMSSLDTERKQTPKLWLLDGIGSLIIARKAAPLAISEASAPVVTSEVPALAQHLMKGITPVTAMLRRTLGPDPRPALILQQDGSVLRSTDSAEIVQEFTVPSGPAGVGFGMVRELVERVHAVAGDGGATAAVVFESATRALIKELQHGASPIALSAETDRVLARERSCLPSPMDSETREQLAGAVRTAIGNELVADVIAETMEMVGVEGTITVEAGSAVGTELKLVEGYRFDRGFLSAYFVTNEDTGEAIYEDAYLLLCTHDIAEVREVLPLLELVRPSGRPLLVIARDVTGLVLELLVRNKIQGTFASVAVKAPILSSHGRAMLEDMAILTGGTVVSDEDGHRLADVGLAQLGYAAKIIVDKNETTIVDGQGAGDQIENRISEIRAEIMRTESDYDRERLLSRLAKLAGGVAIIRVGANSETDITAKTKQFRKAVRTARDAVDFGLVPGAAAALAASADCSTTTDDPFEHTALSTDLQNAMSEPLKAILKNCGDTSPERTVPDSRRQWPDKVFDARSLGFLPADTAGIWDPVLVPRTVLDEVTRTIRQFLDLL